MRTCAHCGGAFTVRWERSPQRCCSRSCASKIKAHDQWSSGRRKREQTVERHCALCGGSFWIPDRDDQRYCSHRCSGTVNSRAGERRGPLNNRYNNGLCFYDGRWIICCRDGSVTHFARAVMAAHIGRLLRSDELVHHVNGDSADDRMENLRIVTRSEHIAIHRKDLQVAA